MGSAIRRSFSLFFMLLSVPLVSSLPQAVNGLSLGARSAPGYGVTCQPSSPLSSSSPDPGSSNRTAASSHNGASILSSASVSSAIRQLTSTRCTAGAGGSGTSWGVPLKPNQAFQATVGGVTAYVCNRAGSGVEYCNGIAASDVDAAVRGQVDAACGDGKPGQAYYHGLLWGYMQAGQGQKICL